MLQALIIKLATLNLELLDLPIVALLWEVNTTVISRQIHVVKVHLDLLILYPIVRHLAVQHLLKNMPVIMVRVNPVHLDLSRV